MLLSSERAAPPMTDAQRDDVDHQLARFLMDCSSSLDRLKALASKAATAANGAAGGSGCSDVTDHMSGILELLLDDLRSLSKEVSSMQETKNAVSRPRACGSHVLRIWFGCALRTTCPCSRCQTPSAARRVPRAMHA